MTALTPRQLESLRIAKQLHAAKQKQAYDACLANWIRKS